MKPPLTAKISNDFQTPPEALFPLIKFLKKEWVICREFKVIASDILKGQNFLTWQPDKFDCIITNPPYSLKQEFLVRCYVLERPFALLLPLTTFETTKRQELFKQYGVQLILFDKRINFTVPDGRVQHESKAWFSTAWFTWGLGLKNELNFVKFGREDNTIQSRLEMLK